VTPLQAECVHQSPIQALFAELPATVAVSKMRGSISDLYDGTDPADLRGYHK